MGSLPEFTEREAATGVICEECEINYVDSSALDSVQLADAELLFCPQCGIAVAVILSGAKRKSA